MQFALPSLLFSECHKYCVDFDLQTAQTSEQQECISNCQEKTYKAFDLYMTTSHAFALKRNTRSQVDISKYTGMEVEHGSDTGNNYQKMLTTSHANAHVVNQFNSAVSKEMGSLQTQALK